MIKRVTSYFLVKIKWKNLPQMRSPFRFYKVVTSCVDREISIASANLPQVTSTNLIA